MAVIPDRRAIYDFDWQGLLFRNLEIDRFRRAMNLFANHHESFDDFDAKRLTLVGGYAMLRPRGWIGAVLRREASGKALEGFGDLRDPRAGHDSEPCEV